MATRVDAGRVMVQFQHLQGKGPFHCTVLRKIIDAVEEDNYNCLNSDYFFKAEYKAQNLGRMEDKNPSLSF